MDWSHRLLSAVTYKTRSGFSDGDYTWSAASTAKCRVEQYPRIVQGVGGEELQASHRVATTTNIPVHARVWLPGADTNDDSESYAVLRREEAYLLDGSYTLYILTIGR